MKTAFWATTIFLTCLIQASAGTITVDLHGNGADYLEIQPAVDAAMDGDLILVQGYTSESYEPFVIDNKGVTLLKVGPFHSFANIQNSSHPITAVEIRNLEAGKRCILSGFQIRNSAFLNARVASLKIHDNAGSVLLENIDFRDSPFRAITRPTLDILNSMDCSIDGMEIPEMEVKLEVSPAVLIQQSQVRISQSSIIGQSPDMRIHGDHDGVRGGPGMEIHSSTVVIAGTDINGGRGGNSTRIGVGGRGGEGILSLDSSVILLGTEDHIIRGGMGGLGSWDPIGPPPGFWTRGGHGGTGIDGDGILVSRVQILGGYPGVGDPSGDSGVDISGDVTRRDELPYLETGGNVGPGETISITCQSVKPGSLLWMISNRSGFQDSPTIAGPPLSALPGDFFTTVSGGMVGANAETLLEVPLPDDPALEGFVLHFQALLLNSGDNISSQAVSVVIGSQN